MGEGYVPAVVAPSPPDSSRRRGFELALALAVLGLGVAAGLQAANASRQKDETERHRPVELTDQEYVSSDECRSCHLTQYESWFNSYHRTMTQLATPASVLGDFADVELSGYRLSREGDRFFVEVPTPEGPALTERAPITLVTGSHHLQIYWYETGRGRTLGQLPFAFLREEQRWVPRGSVFLEPPRGVRPTEAGRWNSSCISCHTTQGKPRFEGGEYDTHVAEFGVACEACHGPGRAHVDKHVSPLSRYQSHFADARDTSIVHPGKLDHRRASEVCSQCHALWQHRGNEGARDWNQHGFRYRPGADPKDSMWLLHPANKDRDQAVAWVSKNQPRYVEGQFWPDGMARVSGREFSGMIDSPCFVRGEMSCLSCHTMHKPASDPRPFREWASDQLAVGMDGDKACLQCHGDYAERLTEHTKHAANSEGSRCMNCHMPYTSYGLLKAMRSHRIDVPDVRATTDAGRPNACTSCHLDRTLAWAAERLQTWHAVAPPPLDDEQRTIASSLLLGVKGDAGQRALVAWAAGWPPAVAASPRADLPALLGTLMDDPYDAVRYVAERSLRSLPGVDTSQLNYDYVQPPHQRKPVAARVAALGGEERSLAERAGVRRTIEILLPQQDQRPMLLLE